MNVRERRSRWGLSAVLHDLQRNTDARKSRLTSRSASGNPKSMFSRMVVEKSWVSCATMEMFRRSSRTPRSSMGLKDDAADRLVGGVAGTVEENKAV